MTPSGKTPANLKDRRVTCNAQIDVNPHSVDNGKVFLSTLLRLMIVSRDLEKPKGRVPLWLRGPDGYPGTSQCGTPRTLSTAKRHEQRARD